MRGRSGSCITAGGTSVAYFSKKLSALRQRASTYAKELWAITESVKRWRHYLLGGTFTIRTDHHSLKNLLNQIIQTLEQQFFLTKLLGYSYDIVYRRGKDNIAVDALSRLPAENSELSSEESQLNTLVCEPISEWVQKVQEENEKDEWIGEIKKQMNEQGAKEGFSIQEGLLMFKQRYCIGPTSNFRAEILEELAARYQTGRPLRVLPDFIPSAAAVLLARHDIISKEVRCGVSHVPTN